MDATNYYCRSGELKTGYYFPIRNFFFLEYMHVHSELSNHCGWILRSNCCITHHLPPQPVSVHQHSLAWSGQCYRTRRMLLISHATYIWILVWLVGQYSIHISINSISQYIQKIMYIEILLYVQHRNHLFVLTMKIHKNQHMAHVDLCQPFHIQV